MLTPALCRPAAARPLTCAWDASYAAARLRYRGFAFARRAALARRKAAAARRYGTR